MNNQEIIEKIKSAFCNLTNFKVRNNALEVITAYSTINSKFVSVFITFTNNKIVVTDIPSMNQVKADWIATTHLHWYPWEKFYAIFIDKLTGPGYEAALQGLKTYTEK